MSYTKILIHSIWVTKNRQPYLHKNIRQQVFDHIKTKSKEKGIYIDSINGFAEHVHCLISLSRKQNIADCLHLIKGESSHWINKEKLTGMKFSWQDDYYAVSVGISQLNNLRSYIRNQEQHHKKRSFMQEEEKFLKIYDFLERI